MATVQNKKGRFSKTGVLSRVKKIGELKTSVVKDKPLIHKIGEDKDEPHYHNDSDEKLFEGSRIIDLLFVMKQLKVYSMWGIAECCISRYQNYKCTQWKSTRLRWDSK